MSATLVLKNSAIAKLALAAKPVVRALAAKREAESTVACKRSANAAELSVLERKVRAAASVARCLGWLSKAFPAAFPTPPVPLKIGIDADINLRLDDWKGRARRREALKFYTRTAPYLAALVEGVDRIDLDGRPAGIVTREQAEAAARLRVKYRQTGRPSDNAKARLTKLRELVS
jgi:ProP effector